MIRKVTRLAIAAMILGALLAPVAAHAEEEFENWTMGEAPLEEEGKATFKGQMRFTFGAGVAWIECNVEMKHTLEPKKSTGHVTSFTAAAKECATGGAFVGCTVSEVKPMNLPWVAHAMKNGATRFIRITGISIEFVQTGFFCIEKKPKVNGNADAFPNIFTSIGSEEFNEESGTLESTYESTATVSGTLKIEGAEAGTYGIE